MLLLVVCVITGPWSGIAAGAAAGEREEAGMAIGCRTAPACGTGGVSESEGRAPSGGESSRGRGGEESPGLDMYERQKDEGDERRYSGRGPGCARVPRVRVRVKRGLEIPVKPQTVKVKLLK